jgi:prolyl-tRNA synthetase
MALASLLSALSLKPSSSEKSTPLKSYYFKPKSSDAELKLVVVAAEEDRDIGKASALAKQLGLKDMRACDDAALKELLGVGKAEGEFPSALLFTA